MKFRFCSLYWPGIDGRENWHGLWIEECKGLLGQYAPPRGVTVLAPPQKRTHHRRACFKLQSLNRHESIRICTDDAIGLAKLISNGEISATEAMNAALTVIDARNPIINAVVVDLRERAKNG